MRSWLSLALAAVYHRPEELGGASCYAFSFQRKTQWLREFRRGIAFEVTSP